MGGKTCIAPCAWICVAQLLMIVVSLATWDNGKDYYKGPTDEKRRIAAVIVSSLSPIYVIILGSVLHELSRKGGVFVNNSVERIASWNCFLFVLLVGWLLGAVVGGVLAFHYFFSISGPLLCNVLVTALGPLSFVVQQEEYVDHLENIRVESARRGRQLNVEQTRTAYELQVHHRRVNAPARRGRGGELDDGRVKAAHADDFFHLQRWMHQLRLAKESGDPERLFRTVGRIRDEMADRSRLYVLEPNERRRYRELALAEPLLEELSAQDEQNEAIPTPQQSEWLCAQSTRADGRLRVPSYAAVLAADRPHSSADFLLPPPDGEAPPPYTTTSMPELGEAV
ncbi:hypothetical protein M3Y99_01540500 [Aphelenchoides fujianensis]|nr:hypothetical protein M3Y99_01540500 [Aphelenchoides fujianensis]